MGNSSSGRIDYMQFLTRSEPARARAGTRHQVTTRRDRRQASLIALVQCVVLAVVMAACSTEPPTPTRRPSPSPAELPNPALLELNGRVRDAVNQEDGFIAMLMDASVGNVPLQPVANSMKLWAEEQARWLDEHPPESCFADVHELFTTAVGEIGASGDGLLALAAQSPPPAEQEFQAQLDHLNTARAGFEAAANAARADVEDCKGE